MDDKTRILMYLVRELASSNFMSRPFNKKPAEYEVHVQPDGVEQVEVGDLVVCMTSGLHPWTVGFLHEKPNSHHFYIREIGSDRICEINNDRMYKICNLSKQELLEGDQQIFLGKLKKVFSQYGDGWRLFGGVRFVGKKAMVTVREKFGGLGKEASTPFDLEIPWGKSMSLKTIASHLTNAGWLTRPFTSKDLTMAAPTHPDP